MRAGGAKTHELPKSLKIERPRDKKERRNSTREERRAFFSRKAE